MDNLAISPFHSRVAVSFFNSLSYHPISFDCCCQRGELQARTQIASFLFNTTIQTRFLDRSHNQGLDRGLVDIKYGFQSIRGKENQSVWRTWIKQDDGLMI